MSTFLRNMFYLEIFSRFNGMKSINQKKIIVGVATPPLLLFRTKKEVDRFLWIQLWYWKISFTTSHQCPKISMAAWGWNVFNWSVLKLLGQHCLDNRKINDIYCKNPSSYFDLRLLKTCGEQINKFDEQIFQIFLMEKTQQSFLQYE